VAPDIREQPTDLARSPRSWSFWLCCGVDCCNGARSPQVMFADVHALSDDRGLRTGHHPDA
jgi:hypothetical protein